MKFSNTLIDVISIDLSLGIVPALMGEVGIGKSSFVEELARGMDTKAFVLPMNQLADKADLTGARLVPTGDADGGYTQIFYPHFVVQEAVKYARENPRESPILFLDEINRTTPDVTSAGLTMVTLRKLGSVELPDNLRLMVAGNDKGNVTTLDEASLSRFAIYTVEPDAPTLINLMGDTMNPWVRKVLTSHPKLVFQKSAPKGYAVDGSDDDDDTTVQASMADVFDTGEDMLQLTTPRTITAVSRFLNTVTEDKLHEYLQTPARIDDRDTTALNEILEGHVGNTDFTTQLISVIADDLANGGAGKPVVRAVPKPAGYDALKKAGSMSDLMTKIEDYTAKEKSGCLMYALHENADNTRMIEQLAASTTTMEPEHNRELVQLASTSLLDKSNVAALLATGTTIAGKLEPVLTMFD